MTPPPSRGKIPEACGRRSVVDRHLPKVNATGSNPVARSRSSEKRAAKYRLAVFSFNTHPPCIIEEIAQVRRHAKIGYKEKTGAMQPDSTILYVEDNPENRLLVRRVLQAEGYSVLEAESAAGALELLHRQQPDLILMDINMPEVDGYTLTTQIKSIPGLERVPIVALTANVMKGDRERTLEAGCDGYIQKPVDVDTFPQQIGRFLTVKR